MFIHVFICLVYENLVFPDSRKTNKQKNPNSIVQIAEQIEITG